MNLVGCTVELLQPVETIGLTIPAGKRLAVTGHWTEDGREFVNLQAPGTAVGVCRVPREWVKPDERRV